jgi:hypothetical protein
MNFRRGSDVPDGGESSGVARLGSARLALGSGWGGIYNPARVISSTDMVSVLSRGLEN